VLRLIGWLVGVYFFVVVVKDKIKKKMYFAFYSSLLLLLGAEHRFLPIHSKRFISREGLGPPAPPLVSVSSNNSNSSWVVIYRQEIGLPNYAAGGLLDDF